MRSPAIALSLLAAALSVAAMAPKATSPNAASQLLSRDAAGGLPLGRRAPAPVDAMRKRQDETTDGTDPAADSGDDTDPATDATVDEVTEAVDEVAAPADLDAEEATGDTPAVLEAATGAAQPTATAMKARGSRVRRRGGA